MPMHQLTHKEREQATAALIAWFKSQDIPPNGAVSVSASAIVTIISAIAEGDHEWANKIADSVAKLIVECVRRLSEIERRRGNAA